MGRGAQCEPGAGPQLVTARRFRGRGALSTGANAVTGTYAAVNNFLIKRFGLDGRERLALAGTVLAAPLAAMASPLIGLGAALALAAPNLARRARARKQATDPAAEAQAALAVHEQVAPLIEHADSLLDEAHARAETLEEELEAIIHVAGEREKEFRARLEEEIGRRMDAERRLGDAEATLEEREWQLARAEEQTIGEEPASFAPPEMPPPAPASTMTSVGPEPEIAPPAFDRDIYMARRREEREDASHVLMPLNPHWAEHILRGDSKFEFRKGALNQLEKGSRVAIYAKAPVKAVTGYFDVENVFIGSPERVWEEVKDEPDFGYTEQEFFAHCGKQKKVTVAKIGSVRRLSEPADAAGLGFKPTDLQGVRYLHHQTDDRHDKVLTLTELEDAAIAEANGGELLAGTGSDSPPEILAAARLTKAKEERKAGRKITALEGVASTSSSTVDTLVMPTAQAA